MTAHHFNVQHWALGTSTSLFPNLTVESVRTAFRAGLTHLEIVIPRRLTDVDLLQPIVDEVLALGMHVHSVHLPYGRDLDPSDLSVEKRQYVVEIQEALLQRVAAWRPKVAIIHPSSEPIEADERDARLQASNATLAQLSTIASELGIRLCVECLPRTCLGNTSDEILTLLEGNPLLSVCCDVNHLFKETPQDFIKRIGDRIETVHISDNDGIDERHWAPGQGVIDWDAVVAALGQIGYAGPFVFEARAPKGDPPLDPHVLSDWWTRRVDDLVKPGA